MHISFALRRVRILLLSRLGVDYWLTSAVTHKPRVHDYLKGLARTQASESKLKRLDLRTAVFPVGYCHHLKGGSLRFPQ